ncbi:MAG: glycosyltransferase family 39 protein [bacterium]
MRPRSWLMVALAAALLVRLGVILAIDNPKTVPRNLAESDAPTYYVLADHLLDGTGYRYAADQAPTAKRTPGYPLFLASVFKVFGRNFTAVRVVQALLDAGTVLLVFAMGVLLFASPGAGALAALGYALYPPAIESSSYIMTETSYTFFLALAMVLMLFAVRLRSYASYALAGLALGVSTLIRPGVVLLPAALLVVGIAVASGWSSHLGRGVGRVLGERPRVGVGPRAVRGLALLCVVFSLVMLPWAVRNQRALDRFIPTSTLVGANLYKGNHPPTQGAYFFSTDSLLTPAIRTRVAGVSEAEKDRILGVEARKMILANKGAVALLTLKKIPRLWLNLGYGRRPSTKSLALAAAHLALVALMICSLAVLPPDVRAIGFAPLTTIVFSTIMYLAVAAEVRFVFPLVPLVLPYSALGALIVFGRLKALTRRKHVARGDAS